MESTCDMYKICRVCTRERQEMFSIFDEQCAEEQTCTNVAAMLCELTAYKVERYDDLPQLICADCRQAVRNAYRLKRKCEQSYRKLVASLGRTKSCNRELSGDERLPTDAEKQVLQAEKCTQTEDTTLYPCERCDEKYFTFDALRAHRESEHKGSAIVCRFCAKSFNRIGYLKTHIAVFHPGSGYTSHNQCHLCRRQFTRREHMRRHLAVIHKIVEISDGVEELIELPANVDKNGEQQPTESDSEIKEDVEAPELQTPQHVQINIVEGTVETSEHQLRIVDINEDPIKEAKSDDEKSAIGEFGEVFKSADASEDEDEKPLSNFLNRTPTKRFLEVLLSENCVEDKLAESDENDVKIIKCEEPLSENKSRDVLSTVKRGRGRPPRKTKAISPRRFSAPVLREYKCEDCDKVFLHESMLQRHVSTHTNGEVEFPCKICSKCFRSAKHLENHMYIGHNTAKVTKCNECNKVFTHTTQYKRHQETKHSDKLHKCDICDKSFTTKIYLQRHMAIHGRKRYVCKECSQGYLTKEELKAHIKAEGHDKPMLCPECGLRCKTSNILMVHMRRHNGEKPFKCKFCSKGFPRMDDLRVHEKYHTGEKSHFCETCGKGFQRKYNLTIHMRVHTGEKPYKCPHCPQAFAQGNDLKAHIRRHTGERFRCEVCGAAFLQGYQIRQHKLTEHGIKEDPPTQRVAKFTSREEQEQQIKQNQQRELSHPVDTTVECDVEAGSSDVEAATIAAETMPEFMSI